jgi:hypothetical protein
VLACALLGVPFLEILGQGARIDYQQAACQCIALLALSEVVARPRLRYWLAAGVFAGLAIATKPLPGLLLGPCFLVASYLAAGARADGSPRPPLARLGAALASPGMWLAGLAVAGCAVLGNPAMLDIGQFVQSQRDAVALHSGNTLQARSSISGSFALLKLPYLIAFAASLVLVAWRRDYTALNIALFIAIYVGAFVGRQARTYFFIAPAAASCLLVAHAWAACEVLVWPRLAKWRALGEPRALALATGLLAVLLVQAPLRSLWSRSAAPNAASVTRAWLYEHVPSGTPIFYLGKRASGPRLVATDRKLQSSWGDHFAYGRHNYKFLKQAFRHAHAQYAKSGKPMYPVTIHADKPYPRKDNKMPRWLTDNLVARARKNKQRYIVLAGYGADDVRALGYPWFEQAALEIEARHIAIFRVPDAAPANATASDAR